jgi:hypothetical protein
MLSFYKRINLKAGNYSTDVFRFRLCLSHWREKCPASPILPKRLISDMLDTLKHAKLH